MVIRLNAADEELIPFTADFGLVFLAKVVTNLPGKIGIPSTLISMYLLD